MVHLCCMSWAELAWISVVVLLTLLLLALSRSDADLTLLWLAKYGRQKEVLAGKVVWITGASSGIGEHVAYRLASAGCKLVLSARREHELNRVMRKCKELTPQGSENEVHVLLLDMLDFTSHENKTEEVIRKLGKVDILIVNAGRTQRGSVLDTHLDVNSHIMDLNYLSVVSLTKQVLPHMVKKQSGHLVLTSSVSGKWGEPLCASYCASKFAVQGWFEAVRMEHPDIDVTIVVPGPVQTNVGAAAFSTTLEPMGAEAGAKESNDKMPVSRCAELMVAAVANRLAEVWISTQPYLVYTYLSQYTPGLARWVGGKILMKAAQKLQGTKKCSQMDTHAGSEKKEN